MKRANRTFWLRFSLRSLVVVIVLISIALAACGDWIRRAERQRYVLREVARLGGHELDVFFTDERTEHGYSRTYDNGDAPRSQFTDSYWRSIATIHLEDDDIPTALVDELAQLPELEHVSVSPVVVATPHWKKLEELRPDIETIVSWQPRHVPFAELTTRKDLHGIANEALAVVFVDGGWSIDCAVFRPVLSRAYENWSAGAQSRHLEWRRIDVSNLGPWHTEVTDWLGNHGISMGGLKQQGAGRVIWIRDGQVAAADWCVDFDESDSILDRIRTIFGDGEITD
jgi:hypothetical protein